MHGVHDEVGGAVHDAAHLAHGVQPLHPGQVHQPGDAAAHGGGAAQGHALFLCQRRQLLIIGGDQGLVGGDHILAPLHGGSDIFIGRVQPAHDLHHRVDGIVAQDVVHVRCRDGGGQSLLGTAHQHPRHVHVLTAGGQLPHAAAHHAEAQQTDIHNTTSLSVKVCPIVPGKQGGVKA